MATIEEVRALYTSERQKITDLDAKLAAENQQIDNAAFDANRTLTAEEKTRMAAIAKQRVDLGKALEVLSFTTLDSLNNASDVDALIAGITQANSDMDGTLQSLKNMESYAADAAAILKGASNILSGLAKLRPTLL